MKSLTMKESGPVVLRIAVSLVFLWFGTQQLIDASSWVRLVPEFVLSITGMSATTLVHLNGAMEVVLGLCLLVGFFTRVSALILALHMIHIIAAVGYGPTGIRDLGIALSTLSVFLYGPTRLSVDEIISVKQSQNL